MKVFLILVAITAFAFAADNGCTTLGNGHHSPTTDNVVLTVLHDWSIPSGAKALGLDIVEDETGTFIVGTDNVMRHLRIYDASTGESIGIINLDTENAGCFGVAWNNTPDTPTYYTSDWSDPFLYYTENFGISWTTVTSPAGNNARGMDFDGTDYWTTNGDGEDGLWRFQPGVGGENLSIPEVPFYMALSGLTVWDYNGDIAVAVTTYQDCNIWIYIWDGSSLTFHGSAALPITPSQGFGLAYSENNHLYWSYQEYSGIYHLVDMTINMTSLSRDSWAGIKTSF